MAKGLDKNRDYGEIFGGGVARFEQDGFLFSSEGKRLKSGSQGLPATVTESIYEDDDGFPDPPGVGTNVAASTDETELDAQLEAQGVL